MHRCAFIPSSDKIIITGGYYNTNGSFDLAEIFDSYDGSITMEFQWTYHGMGSVTINDEDRLAMFGDVLGLIVKNLTIAKPSNGKLQPSN